MRGSGSRASRGPLACLPPDTGFRYQYLPRFRRVALRHGLRLPDDEARRIRAPVVEACG